MNESTSTFILDLKNKNLLSVSHLPENKQVIQPWA